MNEKLALVLKHLIENWKSTVSNLLTVVIITGVYLSTQSPENLTNLGISEHVVTWGTFLSGLAKLYVAFITKDAK